MRVDPRRETGFRPFDTKTETGIRIHGVEAMARDQVAVMIGFFAKGNGVNSCA